MTVLVTNEEQRIVWGGYGLRLHIPCNSLPEDCSHFQLKIAVVWSEHFSLPANGVLVSAVYSFSHDLGDRVLQKPVTIEMQHCANANAVDRLCIIRSDEKSPYKFKDVPGGVFKQGEDYGAIKLDHFCCFATYMWWWLLLSIFTMDHCAKLYYTKITPHCFEFQLYVIPKLDAIMRVGKVFPYHPHHNIIIILIQTFLRILRPNLERETANMNMDQLHHLS